MRERACPVVLAAPSGTGKTTLARRLVDAYGPYRFSVSATTRPPRGAERDGIDYHFVDRARFQRMIAAGELVEWAEVHGRLYGTPRAMLDGAAAEGVHVLLDIDVQGARQLREHVPDVKLIFVLPPSIDALLERLRGRGTEGAEEFATRLRTAVDELRTAAEFDYVVVNDDLERCALEVDRIVRGELAPPETSGSYDAARSLREEIAARLEDIVSGGATTPF